MIRRPPRSTRVRSSAASDVYKRQGVPGGAVMVAAGLLADMMGFDDGMVALMIAAYIAIDSVGTAANVTGDGAIAMIVDKFAGSKKDNTEEESAEATA